MKHALTIALSLAFLGLNSCGDSQAASVVGTYKVDFESMKPEVQKEMGPMAAMIEKMFSAVSIDVKADNTFTVDAKMEMMGQKMDSSGKGTWKFENGKLVMTTTEEGGQPKNEVKMFDYKDGVITGKEKTPDGKEITLVMKKQK